MILNIEMSITLISFLIISMCQYFLKMDQYLSKQKFFQLENHCLSIIQNHICIRFCVIKIVELHTNKSSNNELSLQKIMNIRDIELNK